MGYFVFNFLVAAFVLFDGYRRRLSAGKMLGWSAGAFFLSVLVIPFYFAKRPLRAGETREGGTGWNVLKYFALLWTGLMVVLGLWSIANIDPLATDMEKTGAFIGSIGTVGCMWFVPLVGALVIGLFIRKSSIVEKGPTGPLATSQTG